MPTDYYSQTKMAQPTGKLGSWNKQPTSQLPKTGLGSVSSSGMRSGAGGNTGVAGGMAGGPSSLSSLFSTLGLGGGSGKPGGGGSSSPSPSASPNSSLSVSAPEHPGLSSMPGNFKELQNKYSTYGSELAANNDLSATQAMQRQRDAMSGLAKEYQTGASARGIRGTGAAEQDLINKVITPGQQQLAQLNAGLANSGRQQQFGALQGENSALNGMQGATNNSAQWQQAQQNMGLETWKAQQNNMLAQWQLQNQQQNQGVSQMMALLGAVGNLY